MSKIKKPKNITNFKNLKRKIIKQNNKRNKSFDIFDSKVPKFNTQKKKNKEIEIIDQINFIRE